MKSLFALAPLALLSVPEPSHALVCSESGVKTCYTSLFPIYTGANDLMDYFQWVVLDEALQQPVVRPENPWRATVVCKTLYIGQPQFPDTDETHYAYVGVYVYDTFEIDTGMAAWELDAQWVLCPTLQQILVYNPGSDQVVYDNDGYPISGWDGSYYSQENWGYGSYDEYGRDCYYYCGYDG